MGSSTYTCTSSTDFSPILSNHLSVAFYWASIKNEFPSLSTFTMKATLVWQKPSSHPTRPLPCGKWYLSSVFLDFSVIILSVCIRTPQIKYFVTKTIFGSFMALLSTFQKPCHLPVCLHDAVSVSFPYSLPLGATASISPFAGLGSCVVSFLSSSRAACWVLQLFHDLVLESSFRRRSCLLPLVLYEYPVLCLLTDYQSLGQRSCCDPSTFSLGTQFLLQTQGFFFKASLSIWTLHVLNIACSLKMAQSSSKLSQISTSAIAQANDPKFSYL